MRDSVNRNDLDGLFDVMTEDITFRVVGEDSLGGRIYQGTDDITRHLFFEIFQRLGGGVEISISNLVADSETAFLHFMGKATMKNGSPYHNEYVRFFAFETVK
jgi:ketosteroid isomerase-like protein